MDSASPIHSVWDPTSSMARHTVAGVSSMTVETLIRLTEGSLRSRPVVAARPRPVPVVATMRAQPTAPTGSGRPTGGGNGPWGSRDMGKHTAAAKALAAEQLQPGEELIELVFANYNGGVPSPNLPRGAMPGALGVDAAMRAGHPDAQVVFPATRQMALALTGGRLLVWGLSLTGKPKSFLGEVPLTALAEIDEAEARFGDVLRLALKSGAQVDLEIQAGEPAAPFIANLRALVQDRPEPPNHPDLGWD